ncbi:MAG TPA: hypothetical protein VIW74_07240 [Pyrinomonadaceae bacterium]|jgi:hypothetical protein
MSKSLLFMACILTGLLVLACSKADTNKNATTANSTAPAPAGSVATNKNANATAATGTKIGVEECDTFLTAYENCVTTKIPEAARVQYQSSINTLRANWKKLADNPQTRGTLAAACKQQHDQVRTQLKSFNCTL